MQHTLDRIQSLVRRLPIAHLRPLVEPATAFSVALIFARTGRAVDVDPLDRIGQVSGLAQLQLRFGIVSVLLLCLLAAARRPGNRLPEPWIERVVMAATAGLATGLIAGGLAMGLRGTHFPLNAGTGDTGRLVSWAHEVRLGKPLPVAYPPVMIYLNAWLADLTGVRTSYAYQDMQVYGTALFGPVAYLAWRTVLPPFWALVIGVIPSLPIIEPYRPCTNIILVVLLPLAAKYFDLLHSAASLSRSERLTKGAVFGALLGFLCLTYPGWFWWSLGAAIVLALVFFPWRSWKPGLTFVAASLAGFLPLAFPVLEKMLGRGPASRTDKYFYFDVYVQPAFIAMWRLDAPGETGVWPPHGELGGVGVFTVALAVLVGTALALGFWHARHSTLVRTLSACFVSAWLMRFKYAGAMYATQSVQMYPRTSVQILYCMLALSVLAVLLLLEWLRTRSSAEQSSVPAAALTAAAPVAVPACPHPVRSSWPVLRLSHRTLFGSLAAILFIFASAGAAIADRYLPRDDRSVAQWAWRAHTMRKSPGGSCSKYLKPDKCRGDNSP
jgi:hypothetical protein